MRTSSFNFSNHTRYNFGLGVVRTIGADLSPHRRPLVIIGGRSASACGALQDVEASLEAAGCVYTLFSGVTPNPQEHQGRAAADQYCSDGCDSLVAIGGGSVIDLAKYVAVVLACKEIDPNIDPWTITERVTGQGAHLLARIKDKMPPIYAVVTNSATGSEYNNAFVITRLVSNGSHEKYGARGSYPAVSYVDPKYQVTIPAYTTASGAVDIISHCFETLMCSCWLPHVCETSFELAGAVISSVRRVLPHVLAHPDSEHGRGDLSWAATMALSGLINGQMGMDGTCHAIEHALGAVFAERDGTASVAHGAGLGVVMAGYIRWMAQPEQIQRMAGDGQERLRRVVRALTGVDGVDEGVAAWQAMLRKSGLPATLEELCKHYTLYNMLGFDATCSKLAEMVVGRGSIGTGLVQSKEEVLVVLRLC